MNQSAVTGISVVIPNYNGRELLPQIIPPMLDALQNSMLPFEVIVSDDKSTDDSIAYLRLAYPQLRIVVNDNNRGFASTINAGIFAARHSHVLLLNSDVKLSNDFFSTLIKYFDKEDTFGVMTRIIGWDNDRIQDGGKYPSFHGVKIKTSGNYIPRDDKESQWLYSMYLSGANAFVDRKKLVQLEAFDELFSPFYVEDYELSVRAWRMGWKCYYDHEALCRHKESTTIKSKTTTSKINKIYYRNKMYLHALHLPSALLIFWHIQLLFEILFNLLLLRFYFIGSVFQYIRHIPAVWSHRRSFQRQASDSGRNLLSLKNVTKLVLDNIRQVNIIKLK
jgi:GT2 family glycosyltransferase